MLHLTDKDCDPGKFMDTLAPDTVKRAETLEQEFRITPAGDLYMGRWPNAEEVMEIKPSDPVNPDYYKDGDIECIDAVRAQLSEVEWRGFLRGTIALYNWRLGRKASPDAEKIAWYATWLAGRDPRAKT